MSWLTPTSPFYVRVWARRGGTGCRRTCRTWCQSHRASRRLPRPLWCPRTPGFDSMTGGLSPPDSLIGDSKQSRLGPIRGGRRWAGGSLWHPLQALRRSPLRTLHLPTEPSRPPPSPSSESQLSSAQFIRRSLSSHCGATMAQSSGGKTLYEPPTSSPRLQGSGPPHLLMFPKCRHMFTLGGEDHEAGAIADVLSKDSGTVTRGGIGGHQR